MKKTAQKQGKRIAQKAATTAETVFDKTKSYPINEAIAIAKKVTRAKFDESVEVHIRLGINAGKSDQLVRSVVVLPHGTGKTKRIAVVAEGARADEARAAGADVVGGEDLINQIKTAGSVDADIVVSTPDMMPKLAQIAKILGPKGLMPTPKNETVTQDVTRTVREMKAGKVAFKNDDTANVHQVIGKLSWETEKLSDNFMVFIEAVKKAKPSTAKGTYIKQVFVASTMGPGIRISI